ncbi:hypothetical protein ASE75_00310 [Sphingomonas sp. Leaf17]|uniref:DUF1993 family protein n=1 Tax=Sphingomonas sp. Leaf17 TaxID=1735683 RepID=UPI0006FB53CD|nr:DUF1993 family protein [Sphingomonas sp. Leaf17]KQM67443.1 hypothetical protein ASE75_00310 [Sphingomonas sp. Leaf17]
MVRQGRGAEAIADTLPDGMILNLTAARYARDRALARAYFHIVIAHPIVRVQSIGLGKADHATRMVGDFRIYDLDWTGTKSFSSFWTRPRIKSR